MAISKEHMLLADGLRAMAKQHLNHIKNEVVQKFIDEVRGEVEAVVEQQVDTLVCEINSYQDYKEFKDAFNIHYSWKEER